MKVMQVAVAPSTQFQSKKIKALAYNWPRNAHFLLRRTGKAIAQSVHTCRPVLALISKRLSRSAAADCANII